MNSRKFLTVIGIGVSAVLCLPSYALPVMDVHVEDLVLRAKDVKMSLNLNPNQQLLWQQVESKIRMILHARQLRRERLQAALKLSLDDPRTELRDLAKRLEAEEDLSYQENKDLREVWLTLNDALDDNQRQTVLALLADQLQRSADQAPESKSRDRKDDSRSSGMGRHKSGGMNGGMPQ
jgi:hypothetical protein